MMECPRCGFAQPKDSYCASCGLDIDHYVAKPKPLWMRLVQNSNLHLSLIAILVILVVGYIFYARSEMVQRHVGALFSGSPLSSRDAGDPNQPGDMATTAGGQRSEAEARQHLAAAQAVAAANPLPEPAASTGTASDKAAELQKIEVAYFELSRETLTGILAGSEKVAESSAGRAYLWVQGAKIADTVQGLGKHLSGTRSMAMTVGQQVLLETPPTAPEAFQFGLQVQVMKVEGRELVVKWESSLVMPQPETAAASEAATPTPVVKALNEATFSGSAPLGPGSALLLVLESSNRTPREENIAKAGEGPWSIFTSEEFRAGTTEWVALIQLK